MGGTGTAPDAPDPTSGRGTGASASALAPATPRSNVFGHQAFSGTERTRMETSGRLSLPSAFRYAFDGHAIIRNNRNTHLMLYTLRGFDALVDQFEATSTATLGRSIRQDAYSSAPAVVIDRQHRMVIPPELREMVGLGENLVLTGAIECVNIYSATYFDEHVAPRFDEFDLFLDGHGGLPTGTA